MARDIKESRAEIDALNRELVEKFCRRMDVATDVAEDMMAGAKVGLRGFLLTDCLINTPNADIEQYPHGSFEELNTYLDTLIAEN